jgi:carbamoylphosphate synthase large subunit
MMVRTLASARNLKTQRYDNQVVLSKFTSDTLHIEINPRVGATHEPSKDAAKSNMVWLLFCQS